MTSINKSVSFRMNAELSIRLDKLAKITGRSKSFYISEAVNKYTEELEKKYYKEYKMFEEFEKFKAEYEKLNN